MSELRTLPTGDIIGVSLFPIGQEYANALSAVTISTAEILNTHDKSPLQTGVASQLMGTWNNTICAFCRNDRMRCVGHNGAIEFPPGYCIISPIMMHAARKYLQIVCHKCFKRIKRNISLSRPNTSGANRGVCVHCGYRQPEVKIAPSKMAFMFKKDGVTKVMNPQDVAPILRSIPDSTITELGIPLISHPRNFIITKMLITPIRTRPIIKIQGATSKSSQSAMTRYYQDIYKGVHKLKETTDPDAATDIYNSLLALIYNTIVNNNSKTNETNVSIRTKTFGAANVSSAAGGAILHNLAGKHGLFRGKALGKVTGEIGRAVIISNQDIKPDEIVIPIAIAKHLSRYIYVQKYNIDLANTYLQNGISGKYPGATGIIKLRADGKDEYRVISPSIANAKFMKLEYGDILVVNLKDGDFVMMNRMPTLSTSSINAHRVIINNDPNSRSIEIQVGATEPYNADYDGDNMSCINVVRPSTEAELRILMRLNNVFIGFGSGSSTFGHRQDEIIGGFQMCWANLSRRSPQIDAATAAITATVAATADTKKSGGANERSIAAKYYNSVGQVLFTKAQVMFLFSNNTIIPRLDLDPADKMYSGYDILSFVFPRNINVNATPTVYREQFKAYIPYDESMRKIAIKNGRMTGGVHDKGSGDIYRAIYTEYGSNTAMEALFNTQQIMIRVPSIIGYTICPQDFMKPKKMCTQIMYDLEHQVLESLRCSERLMRAELRAPIGVPLDIYFEDMQRSILNADYVAPILSNIDFNENNFAQAALSKASGDYINLQYVYGSYGQTTFLGKRVGINEPHYSSKRVSPYHTRFDLHPDAYGFVANSVIDGCDPRSFVPLSISARHDIIEKSQNMAECGYTNRQACSCMSDIICDNTYRCANGESIILQLMYGDDGCDPRYNEKAKLATLNLSNAELESQYADATTEERVIIRADRDAVRKIIMRHEQLGMSTFDANITLPINVERVIENEMLNNPHMLAENASDVEDAVHDSEHAVYDSEHAVHDSEHALSEMRKMRDEFVRDIAYLYYNDQCRIRRAYIPPYKLNGLRYIVVMINYALHSGILRKLTLPLLTKILERIKFRLQTAMMNAGTPVGILTALSLGAPTSQLTLNAIHKTNKAGGRSTDFASMSEILRVYPINKCKNLSMSMMLKPGITEERGHQIVTLIEMLTLDIFIESYQLFPESFAVATHREYKKDQAAIDEFLELAGAPDGEFQKWCLRLELNLVELRAKYISVVDIVKALRKKDIYVIYTDEGAADRNIFIRMYFRPTFEFSTYDQMTVYAATLLKLPIRGVNDVKSARLHTGIKRTTIGADGEIVMEDRMCITTVGINMYGMFAKQLELPEIDYNTLECDNIAETESVMGILAAKTKIIIECTSIFDAVSKLDSRHYALLAEVITYSGKCIGIKPAATRIRKVNILQQIANESPVKAIEGAVMRNQSAPIRGIAPAFLCGLTPKIGTGYHKVIINRDFVTEHRSTAAP
jgi:DNA-directed RNA polymerase beta' subunit